MLGEVFQNQVECIEGYVLQPFQEPGSWTHQKPILGYLG